MKKKRPKTLRPVHANAGVEAEYRRKLTALVDAMHASVLRSLRAAYRREEPRVVPAALDESPAVADNEFVFKMSS